MKLIQQVHPETHQILSNARADLDDKKITQEQYNEIVLSCFKAEAAAQMLSAYAEAQ